MKISIIIPCYNSESYISRAIDSVLNQTYNDWELILVDNNSTDNTRLVLERYKEEYPEKIQVFSELKKGAPAARNTGLENARGKWIQFLDSDDELPIDKLERQLYIAKETKADIVIGRHVRIVYISKFVFKLHFKPSPNIWEALIRTKLGITSANLWYKESILSVGGWDEDLTSTQEYDLIFRMLQSKAKIELDHSNDPVNVYCVNNSITRSDDTQKNIEQFTAFINLRYRIKEYMIAEKLYSRKIEAAINSEIYNCYLYKKQYLPEGLKNKIESVNVPLIPKFKSLLIYKTKKFIKILIS